MTAALLLALASLAAAQSPLPYSNDGPPSGTQPAAAPAASTAAVVAASTETVVAVSTGGVRVAGEVKAKLTRPIHAVIHPEAKEWEPLSLRAGGDPGQAETKAILRQSKIKGRYRGAPSKAKAIARVYKAGHDRWLIVSIFPKSLEKRRAHLEVRFRIAEGFIEEAGAALVSVVDRRRGLGAGLDSRELDARGIAFEEDTPSSGSILVAALDPRPSRSAFNAGTLKLAAFGDKDVGLADASWAATGLPAKP